MLKNYHNQQSKAFLREFLAFFPGHIIQTLDDKSCKDSTPHRLALPELVSSAERTPYFYEELQLLNKKGAGIFFAYNDFHQKRNKNDIKNINAWAMEIDDISKEEQRKKIIDSPILPSFIIETKKSLHCYWLAKNATLDKAREINTRLQHFFNSDKAVKDIARMLRLPGFFHNKQEPFLVKLVHDDSDQLCTEEEMVQAFPLSVGNEQKNSTITTQDPFWIKVLAIPTKAILNKLSGTDFVNCEVYSYRKRTDKTEYIDVNNKPADCWLDEDGLIGSGKDAGPSIIQWLEYYGHDKAIIAEWIKGNCKDLMEKANDVFDPNIMNINQEEKEDIINTDKRVFTWGTENLNNNITPINGVVMFSGATGSGKTTFCTFVAFENVKIGNRALFLSLEMTEDEIYTRFARSQAGITKNQWRDKSLISEYQKSVYLDKKQQLRKLENLYLKGFPKEIETSTANIFKAIEYFKPDLVFIDNFDLIHKKQGSEYEEQNRVSAELKEFSQTTKIPLVVLHHQKTGASDKSKKTTVDLLRGSGKIEHNAYAHISGIRMTGDELTEQEKSSFLVKEHKDREFGGTSKVVVYFDKGNFRDEYVSPNPYHHLY